MDTAANAAPGEERKPTAPDSFQVSLRSFATEQQARKLGELAGTYVRVLSADIDLARLDGVTIAFDYAQALLDLDRGYESTVRLTPSDEFATGVAMTVSVIRDNQLRSHIVLHAEVATWLEKSEGDQFATALHLLAHECAHVEVTARFEDAFPGELLRKRYPNIHDAFRWQVILACWDEYAVTWIAAPFGKDPAEGYEQTFLLVLNETRAKANNQIKAFRVHGEVDRIMAEVFGTYGDLMKFACYVLGNMQGQGLSLEQMPGVRGALAGHWFEPHFTRLAAACAALAANYGSWTDQIAFEAVGDILDEMVEEGGLFVTHLDDGGLYLDVPYTLETLPV